MEELLCELYYRYVGWNNQTKTIYLNDELYLFSKLYHSHDRSHNILLTSHKCPAFNLSVGMRAGRYVDLLNSKEIKNQMLIDYKNWDKTQFNLAYRGSLDLVYFPTLKSFLDLDLKEE